MTSKVQPEALEKAGEILEGLCGRVVVVRMELQLDAATSLHGDVFSACEDGATVPVPLRLLPHHEPVSSAAACLRLEQQVVDAEGQPSGRVDGGQRALAVLARRVVGGVGGRGYVTVLDDLLRAAANVECRLSCFTRTLRLNDKTIFVRDCFY